MHTEQAFQLQLIIQILMTDYLQQEIDISEDVGKGSTASSGHITISFAIKSYSKTLCGTAFVQRADMQCNFRDSTISLWLTHTSHRERADAQGPYLSMSSFLLLCSLNFLPA